MSVFKASLTILKIIIKYSFVRLGLVLGPGKVLLKLFKPVVKMDESRKIGCTK